MNHPVSMTGYQSKNFNLPKGRGIKPSSAAGGLKHFWTVKSDENILNASNYGRNSWLKIWNGKPKTGFELIPQDRINIISRQPQVGRFNIIDFITKSYFMRRPVFKPDYKPFDMPENLFSDPQH